MGIALSTYYYYYAQIYYNLPCWILVPACTLDELKGWKPENAYPVLAMACGCANISTAKAYQNLCNGTYNDNVFDASTATNGKLTRSKCTKKQFANATENIKRMTLAMAETLVGKGVNVRPNNGLEGTADNLTETEYESIAQRLKAKSTEQTAEELHNNKKFGPKIFNAVQFSETIKCLDRDGIKVPQAKEGINSDHCELLVFEVNPNSGLDVYPDPMLLLIKAAINWSWYCGQKLLPACGPASEEGDDMVSPPVPTTIEFRKRTCRCR